MRRDVTEQLTDLSRRVRELSYHASPEPLWRAVLALLAGPCFHRMRVYRGASFADRDQASCGRSGWGSAAALEAWWWSGGYGSLLSQVSGPPAVAFLPSLSSFYSLETTPSQPSLRPWLCSLDDPACTTPEAQRARATWQTYLDRRRAPPEGPRTAAGCARAAIGRPREERYLAFARCVGGTAPVGDVVAPGRYRLPTGWLVLYGPSAPRPVVKGSGTHLNCDEATVMRASTGAFARVDVCAPVARRPSVEGPSAPLVVERGAGGRDADGPAPAGDVTLTVIGVGRVAAERVRAAAMLHKMPALVERHEGAVVARLPKPIGPHDPLVEYGIGRCGDCGGGLTTASFSSPSLYMFFDDAGTLVDSETDVDLTTPLPPASPPDRHALRALVRARDDGEAQRPCLPEDFRLPDAPGASADDLAAAVEPARASAAWRALRDLFARPDAFARCPAAGGAEPGAERRGGG